METFEAAPARLEGGARVAVRVGCEFELHCEVAMPAVVMVRPRDEGDCELSQEEWLVRPASPSRETADVFGNRIRRLVLPAGESTLRYDAVVTAPARPADTDLAASQVAPDDLPDDLLIYVLPSRYCPSDQLVNDVWALFGGTEPGWARVQAVSDWTHDNVRFDAYATHSSLTAADTFQRRAGVCRDFAQLAIAFCRALNIPARYAFGYLPDINVPPSPTPMDFCAWMEVYLSGRWWTFDPRNNQRRIAHIVIGRGRDAADVPMLMSFGTLLVRRLTVWADPIGI
ncbi:MAG TPA: transglutaminase family protein [Candidatus Binatia bacterium]|nr:transglutaminase family protein [Candidatus Binatia bacterium]